jgi:hypothetical protein
MTDQQHPITPPPELVQQWYDDARDRPASMFKIEMLVVTRAAQWAADMELEACLANIHTMYGKDKADWLRAMRRPKPPSLKEQALEELENMVKAAKDFGFGGTDPTAIRRVLEALPND